jgi:hypothetical protein
MFCSQCGHPNQEAARFCGQCGAGLHEPETASKSSRLWFWLLLIGALSLLLATGLVIGAVIFWSAPAIEPVALAPATPAGPLLSDPQIAESTLPATPMPPTTVATNPATETALPTKTATPSLTPAPTATLPAPTATLPPEPAGASPVIVEEITVSATAPRNATNIFLSQGQQVTIEYLSGSWRPGPSPAWPLVGPRGDPRVASKATFPLPNASIMTLIAGAGETPPFAVSERLSFMVAIPGLLWLGANDDDFSDNGGSLMVRITVVSSEARDPVPPDIDLQLSTAVESRRVSSPPQIDGLLTEWADFPAFLSGHRVYSHPSWNGDEDLVAFWQLGWDDHFLYIAATVVDDVHVQTQTGNLIYRGDSLELQIDTNRAAGLDYLSPAVYQILLSPGDFVTLPPSAFRFRGNDQRQIRDAPGHAIRVAAHKTLNGYTLVAAIPWRDLGVAPRAGLVLGLALNANDNDTPGTTVQEVMMSNVPGRMLTNPSTWGTLTLLP